MCSKLIVGKRIAPCGEGQQSVAGIDQRSNTLGDWLPSQIPAMDKLRTKSLYDWLNGIFDPLITRIVALCDQESHSTPSSGLGDPAVALVVNATYRSPTGSLMKISVPKLACPSINRFPTLLVPN